MTCPREALPEPGDPEYNLSIIGRHKCQASISYYQEVKVMPDYEKYIACHRQQLAREKEKLAKLTRQAKEKAKAAAEQLACRYRVKRVYLFGSLAMGGFDEESDIDLAVYGLPDEKYLKAYGLAESITLPFKVDLVSLESAVDTLKARVEREGIVLFDHRTIAPELGKSGMK